MQIIQANISHLDAFLAYAKQCADDGLHLYSSTTEDHQAYFKKRLAYAEGKQLPAHWPAITTYFCIKSTHILGSIRVRHGTNEKIENITGHIGFETLPTARKNGIAYSMLNWVLTHVVNDKVLITCSDKNIASRRLIEKCGGQYLGDFCYENNEQRILRYQLHNKSLNHS
ncbi:GNAT family N-acetyltransferase [Psychromonas sp. KJ10-2]|uniref:GNAT family N-acetyltransferase n=1 Tax=Psychromonas sp. KJ10-2 TaxID=3391822 RepID=UPI0039B66278